MKSTEDIEIDKIAKKFLEENKPGPITDVYAIDEESQIELDKTQKGKPPIDYDE